MDDDSDEQEQSGEFLGDKRPDTTLPSWITEHLPVSAPVSLLSFKEGKFHTSHDNQEFDKILDAYKHLQEDTGCQIVLDDSLEGHGGYMHSGAFIYESEVSGRTSVRRILYPRTTENDMFNLQAEFFFWLHETVLNYEANPTDFVQAHIFLTRHPVFWHKIKKRKSFLWRTENGLNGLVVEVGYNPGTQVPLVTLITGAHDPESHYTMFRPEGRLVVRGVSYEEAIVKLAEKVHEFYDPDGTDRTEHTG